MKIALTIAGLNDLEVKAGDIMNAYLTAPITEKVWTVIVKEWGPGAVKKAIIVRALYGLKYAGAAFRKHLAYCMRVLGYKSCPAYHDLWYTASVDLDGDKYYSYILCYVDDILVVHHDVMTIMKKINKFFLMKPDSIGDPNMYLWAKIKYHKTPSGMWYWTMSPSKYVHESCNNCKDHPNNNFDGKYKLPKQAPNPFVMVYEAELDTSTFFDPDSAKLRYGKIGSES